MNPLPQMDGHGSSTRSSGPVQPHVAETDSRSSLKIPAELPKSSSASTLSSADVAVDINRSSSIYDLHNHRHRWLVLLQVAVAALLVPFTGKLEGMCWQHEPVNTSLAATAWQHQPIDTSLAAPACLSGALAPLPGWQPAVGSS
jgi:hypothetical protein